jgi:CheY-like chemotaxis protein
MVIEPIRVLLVDDHKVVRNGLRMMLAAYSDIAVVAEAADANAAMQCLREHEHEVDVVLCDIGLPGRSGLELLKMIKAQWPKLAVLMLTMYQEDMYAVRAGGQARRSGLPDERCRGRRACGGDPQGRERRALRDPHGSGEARRCGRRRGGPARARDAVGTGVSSAAAHRARQESE